MFSFVPHVGACIHGCICAHKYRVHLSPYLVVVVCVLIWLFLHASTTMHAHVHTLVYYSWNAALLVLVSLSTFMTIVGKARCTTRKFWSLSGKMSRSHGQPWRACFLLSSLLSMRKRCAKSFSQQPAPLLRSLRQPRVSAHRPAPGRVGCTSRWRLAYTVQQSVGFTPLAQDCAQGLSVACEVPSSVAQVLQHR